MRGWAASALGYTVYSILLLCADGHVNKYQVPALRFQTPLPLDTLSAMLVFHHLLPFKSVKLFQRQLAATVTHQVGLVGVAYKHEALQSIKAYETTPGFLALPFKVNGKVSMATVDGPHTGWLEETIIGKAGDADSYFVRQNEEVASL